MHKQTRGSTKLREWLEKTGTKQKDLGAKLGTHQTNVSAWLLGRPISLAHAIALQKITKIRPEDWTLEAESGSDVSASAAKAS